MSNYSKDLFQFLRDGLFESKKELSGEEAQVEALAKALEMTTPSHPGSPNEYDQLDQQEDLGKIEWW